MVRQQKHQIVALLARLGAGPLDKAGYADAVQQHTGLALVPLVLRGNIPGQEIEHPMAMVILGGLITSTLLNLFVVPSLYLHFARPRPA